MPAPYRKTPARFERMLELHKQGASAREIAEDLKVGSHGTILNWLRDAGLRPNGGQGARSGRPRLEPDEVSKRLLAAQQELAELGKGPAPANFGEVMGRLLEQFQQVQALVKFHIRHAGQGDSTMAELQKAIQIQDTFATRIRELTPATPPDPATDPANADAAAEVRDKFAIMVQAAEAEFRCKHCGASPF